MVEIAVFKVERTISKSSQTRVTIHVFCTSSYSALHLCEVYWKNPLRYQSYRADTNDGSADGRKDNISDGIT